MTPEYTQFDPQELERLMSEDPFYKFTTNIEMVPGEVYEKFTYPAGEMQVRLTKEGIKLLAEHTGDKVHLGLIRVIARIRSSDDVIELVQLLSAIESVAEFAKVEVVLPYLPYGRADRRFVPGDCFGVEAFGNILAATGIANVLTLDVHSATSRIKVPNLVNVRPDPLIRQAIERFGRTTANDVNVLFPDEGARRRYADLTEGKTDAVFGCNNDPIPVHFYHASKQRDPKTGALSGFEVPKMSAQTTLIVDDICDGGGTFLGLAEKLPGRVLGLYVTHGIFSKGTKLLTDKFNHIFTTNSFYGDKILDRNQLYDAHRNLPGVPRRHWDNNPHVTVLDAMPLLLGGPEDIQ